MIKEALEYLVGLKDTKLFEIDGENYADRRLERIPEIIDRPKTHKVNSLDAIVQLIKTEKDVLNAPLFVEIDSPRQIVVYTTYDHVLTRDIPYEAVCEDCTFREGWRNHDEAIIELRSRFLPSDDADYLLDLLSCMSKEEGVTTNDNGVTQTVTAKQGVSLKENVTVKPIISLKPFRTFREVKQPESEFLLRVDEDGSIGLFEADGGIWKMEAKDNIAAYFREALAEEINQKAVFVLV